MLDTESSTCLEIRKNHQQKRHLGKYNESLMCELLAFGCKKNQISNQKYPFSVISYFNRSKFGWDSSYKCRLNHVASDKWLISNE